MKKIWFSDESRFLLQKRDGSIRVYRRRNERFSSSCVLEVDSFGGGSVMMWSTISNECLMGFKSGDLEGMEAH
jgi:hypothetical protein